MSEGRALQRTPNRAPPSRSPSADAQSLSPNRGDRGLRGESAAHPRAEQSPAGFRGSHVDLATYAYYDLDAPRARAPGWSSLARTPADPQASLWRPTIDLATYDYYDLDAP